MGLGREDGGAGGRGEEGAVRGERGPLAEDVDVGRRGRGSGVEAGGGVEEGADVGEGGEQGGCGEGGGRVEGEEEEFERWHSFCRKWWMGWNGMGWGMNWL